MDAEFRCTLPSFRDYRTKDDDIITQSLEEQVQVCLPDVMVRQVVPLNMPPAPPALSTGRWRAPDIHRRCLHRLHRTTAPGWKQKRSVIYYHEL